MLEDLANDPRLLEESDDLHLPTTVGTVAGFRTQDLVSRVGAFWNASYTPRQATYDLRRLKRKGFITKIAHSHRYHLTPLGRRVAVLFPKTYGRVLAPGLVALDLQLPDDIARTIPVARAWRRLNRDLNEFMEKQLLAA